MPLSWNEIKDRSLAFSRKWDDESSEDAEAKSFWDDFFSVFGLSRRRVASFEEPVKKLGNKHGYIDLFWKGVLLVEHKSRGKDLDRAYTQALDYFPGITENELPKYVLVSDFARFRLYQLESGEHWEFKLKDFYKHIKRFGFIAGYQTQQIKEQDPVNVKAAEQMGKLHDQLKASGYEGHALEVYLVRLLFCLFADDTTIFNQRGQFQDYLENRTASDGADLGQHLAGLFQVLNTPEDKRQKTLDEQLAAFPYVNGKLFEESLPLASFDATMRTTLLGCCLLDWGRISPAVFGALFQSVMDPKLRRNLGAHYTSEKNILKLIKPLFLDDLWEEFHKVKGNKNKLFEFLKKLNTLTFLDPACGCGNFLVIAYRELRLLELEILKTALASDQKYVDVFGLVRVDVDQFYGIEIEEFPAQIAQVAMWLMDHQMNMRVSEEFGMYFARLPLRKSATIVNENALSLDWEQVIVRERVSYILGNPPFVGSKFLDDAQRRDLGNVLRPLKDGGVLDLVAGWYVKAADYIRDTRIRCAFVSTNSITQGEQVGALWSWMLGKGMKIHFAHRTFRWSNEAPGMAAVHCVIIGFAAFEMDRKVIFHYDKPTGEPHLLTAKNINPYLVDAQDVVLMRRSHPIDRVPDIGIGNKPVDGGYYLFTPSEKTEFLETEPEAAKCFRKWIGAKELLNGVERWCLWTRDCAPAELRRMPRVMEVIDSVRRYRLGEISNKSGTREAREDKPASTKILAAVPTKFHVENLPTGEVLVIPRHSSEARAIIPMGYFGPDVLIGDACLVLNDVSLFHFGILSSTMHNAWVRYTCGRIKSDFRYSAEIVYNNFPWPREVDEKQVKVIEAAGQAVLDTRAQFPESSLADLYDPLTMPAPLTKAHQVLDRAVDVAYVASSKRKAFAHDAERVAFLFELYQQYTSLLPAEAKKKPARAVRKAVR
jgi:hypothetical protein